ncbi:hypothetical protein HUW46_09254 [Amycolatopsis sp. CA-230715]|nr:hypothetical protein HUW46_09254 [Amycolatopsis sp. CA-230715]
MVADLVLREARDYYRQRIRLDCGHVHVFYVSSRQLTGNTHPCAYDLLFVPQAYWETGPMYCNRCDGRPERTVTGVEIESHRMVCEEIMLTCGHTLKQMHRASQSPLSLDGGFERPCTGCLGRPRGGVSIRTLSAG